MRHQYSAYHVQRFDSETIEKREYSCHILCRCKYFETMSYQLNGTCGLDMDGNSFGSVLCVTGEGTLKCRDSGSELALKAGDSVFIPAAEKKLFLEGNGEFIVTHI